MADFSSSLPVQDKADGVDGSIAPALSVQVAGKDASGNLQTLLTAVSGEQFVKDSINISTQYRAQSVTTTAAQALGGATILANRKFIIILPTNGVIYWGTNSSVTTTTGMPVFLNQSVTLAFTDNVPIYLIAAQTTDVRIVEGS